MSNDLTTSLRPALVMTGLFALTLGIAYPLAITGVAQVAFPHQANGSLVERGGKAIGSTLIGQNFASDRYFHPRPSAAGKGYDATASSGSNLGPTSQALADRVKGDVARLPVTGKPIPPDLVTTSASGLDPDISPEAALYQADRVATARHLDPAQVKALVRRSVDTPILAFLGDPHVNVLALNRALDAIAAR
ncbi:potassium-transporting ATPase subunit KdpC [Sphingomonas sp. CGMCC 1.13654]|uniref:Potassium-transporting ATPase KdpC subunit n=1 Tax=Sphingomonas chungangi TaxID=2683589 RepID=A0A838LCP5_9SPHN|nr:potassium-transporting ATPase subunit KdpC [Sphingomonas chungangi]MBA2936652.1 potassium-transporting ATPase subunit KdpC [Sphingomonas chungangi]MVW56037.1 potassium-transporting ATPase subunit KdpC [Sphingomonas chungangi]